MRIKDGQHIDDDQNADVDDEEKADDNDGRGYWAAPSCTSRPEIFYAE